MHEKYVFDPRLKPRSLFRRPRLIGAQIAAVALIAAAALWRPESPVDAAATIASAITAPADVLGGAATPEQGSAIEPTAVGPDAGQRPEATETSGTEAGAPVAALDPPPAAETPAGAEPAAVDPTPVAAIDEGTEEAAIPAEPSAAEEKAGNAVTTAAEAVTGPDAHEEPGNALPSRLHRHTVAKGDTLAQVLRELGVEREDRVEVLAAANEATELAELKIGQEIHAQVDSDGGLLNLRLQLDAKTSLHVELDDDDYRVHRVDRPVEKRISHASGLIQSSLFGDGQEAGLSDAQIMELAAIFGWDIDFALGVRPGDRFNVIYEAEYLDGQKIDNGTILAAEFVNQGTAYRALRFEDDDGTLGYYAPDGTSKKQAFLRTPIKLARVSSGFSLSRMHPILNTRRAHKGVDYSAPTGTPVKATGSGLVTFTGRKNGYGNVVELKHGDTYSTLYAHLSRFASGLRVGEKVQQGEVIGYVGQTGIATGPHLHYEFRVAGQHRDPMSTKLPTAVPLSGNDLAEFKEEAAPLLAQLDRMERTMVARAE